MESLEGGPSLSSLEGATIQTAVTIVFGLRHALQEDGAATSIASHDGLVRVRWTAE